MAKQDRILAMEKLECQKVDYKNFKPEKDRFLNLDSAAGMKKLAEKFGGMEEIMKSKKFWNIILFSEFQIVTLK